MSKWKLSKRQAKQARKRGIAKARKKRKAEKASGPLR
jgi:hypothetical protein